MRLALLVVALLGLVCIAQAVPAKGRGLKKNKVVDYDWVIEMKENVDMTAYGAHLKTLNKAARHQLVKDVLSGHANTVQFDLIQFLKSKKIAHRSNWINNAIYVVDLTPKQIETLSRRADVKLVRRAAVGHIITPTIVNDTVVKRDQWSVDIINAPQAHDAGFTGEGVVVSNIDTGVRWTHVSLRDSYRGSNGDHDYNWFDPVNTREPNDGNGHGTHTMGTIAGTENGIGVAIGSLWIAAKGCRTALCPEADLTASAEWVLCPTTIDGGDEDCSMGADVVSNSWGGGQADNWYEPYTTAWRNAGMIPVFAMGNSGPACGTANSPGDLYNVIGVGATDSNDRLASFSSRGPGRGTVTFPLLKPDISAPGAAVVSASSANDNLYATLSGTSMACPSIAGVVALVLGANPSIDYDGVYDALTSTADTGVGQPNGGQTACSGVSWNTFPNYHYGYGRVDALASVNAALKLNR